MCIRDSDSVFNEKLEQAFKTIENARSLRVDGFRKQGKNSDSFDTSKSTPSTSSNAGEIKRRDPKTGKIAIFDKDKKFLRFEGE